MRSTTCEDKRTLAFVVMCLAISPVAGSSAADAQVPEYELVPTVRIGSVDDAATALTVVSLLAIAPDGRLAVSQPVESSVWIYSPAGERLAVVGREGEGPGEFRGLSMLGWHGDTLWVADGSLYRVSFFTPGHPVPTIVGGNSRRIEQFTRVPLPAAPGRWLTVRQTIAEPAVRRYRQEVWSLDQGWKPVQALAVFPKGPERLVIVLPNNAIKRTEQPFAEHPIFAVAPDVSSVTIVRRELGQVSGHSGGYTVTQIASTGDTVFHHERPVQLQPLTTRTRQAVIDALASPDAWRLAPSIGAVREAINDSARFPEYHPPVTKVLAGADGSTWLRGPDDRTGMVRWLVLDRAGEPVWTVITDRKLGMLFDGNFSVMAPDARGVWGVVHDDLGVPYVVRYELRSR